MVFFFFFLACCSVNFSNCNPKHFFVGGPLRDLFSLHFSREYFSFPRTNTSFESVFARIFNSQSVRYVSVCLCSLFFFLSSNVFVGGRLSFLFFLFLWKNAYSGMCASILPLFSLSSIARLMRKRRTTKTTKTTRARLLSSSSSFHALRVASFSDDRRRFLPGDCFCMHNIPFFNWKWVLKKRWWNIPHKEKETKLFFGLKP